MAEVSPDHLNVFPAGSTIMVHGSDFELRARRAMGPSATFAHALQRVLQPSVFMRATRPRLAADTDLEVHAAEPGIRVIYYAPAAYRPAHVPERMIQVRALSQSTGRLMKHGLVYPLTIERGRLTIGAPE